MVTTVKKENTQVSLFGRLARLSTPPLQPNELPRQRLLDFIYEHIHRKLILVSAAAGYGKTALVTSFAHDDTGYPVAWYQPDESAQDLTVLVSELTEALGQRFPHFESRLASLARQPGITPETLAATLIREIDGGFDDYFVLVLDGFEVVEDSEPVMQFFNTLLADLPEQAHLIISSRTIPPLNITSLVARQQIAGLSEEHLRFTADEAQALLKLHGQALPTEEDVEKLVARTEGWVMGIVLSTLQMQQGLPDDLPEGEDSAEPLYTYLVNEVLERQPQPLRRFLLESAVLPEMTPDACNEVLGISNSAELLQQVETQRLFISTVNEESRTFQYHNLFRDSLIAKLKSEQPQRLTQLETRAGEWYVANDMPDTAFSFYVMAGQLQKAAQVADINARSMFFAGRHITLRRWAEQLETVAHEAPKLYLKLTTADIDAGDLVKAESDLAIASAGFEQRDDPAGAVGVQLHRSLILYRQSEFEQSLAIAQTAYPRAEELGEPDWAALALLYTGRAQFALGQLSAAEDSLRQALKLTRHRYDFALLHGDLALVLHVRGKTEAAEHTQQQALEIWRELGVPRQLSLALNNTGNDQYLKGQYEAALATYSEALEWARQAGSSYVEGLVLAGQADIYADLGDRALATDLYHKSLGKTELAGDWALTAYLYRAMAQLERWSRNYNGALGWLRRAEEASRQGQVTSRLANLGGLRGIILVEMKHIKKGRETLEQTCIELENAGASVDLAQTLFMRARAEFIDSDTEAAAKSLANAFVTSAKVGYDQMLIGEALQAREMLEAFRQHTDIGARVAALLARLDAMPVLRARLQKVAPQQPLPAQPAALQVRALGKSRVLKEGEEVTRKQWVSQRTRELFLFLVDRAPIARDQVLQTFWPDKPQSRASANFHQTLYRMRRAIGHDVVTLEEQECRLAQDISLDYDVERFETLAHTALATSVGDPHRLKLLDSALRLYVGNYLGDLEVDWARRRRQALSELHITLLRSYADELIAVQRFGEARDQLQRALKTQPLRDDLHERMLLCLAGLGRQHEVVNHYLRYSQKLREDLGLDPPEQMRALYARLIE